ncbi:MAG: bifunctional phosphoribosylaminoimidazolecarboxamide formyltransferase/IMP cyclohydrolase [Oligoflexia bacterium]|nr:bifunctional phosphoribosylaminoimidazolecarboxamide formyltransferase/IMP cyclohydrolase [Oligoflexia bacterium]
MDDVKIKRAALSVSNKRGIVELAKFLQSAGIELISTGGTGKALSDSGISYTTVESITGNPEAFGGRMKTISFPFASALLYRRNNEEDCKQAEALGVKPIDLVVCNLYPFIEARNSGCSEEKLIEQIDIGGPTMVRAAAKNFSDVVILTDPADYPLLVDELNRTDGATTLSFRKRMAAKAFRLSAQYEMAISSELSKRFLGEECDYLSLQEGRKLRYGENPHQSATFYKNAQQIGKTIASADIIQGKALSYNNILDADAALRSMSDVYQLCKNDFPHIVSIIKHLNPCGLAAEKSQIQALENAWAGDPVSAFGGILAFSSELSLESVEWLEDKFIELLIAPSIHPDAINRLSKKKNIRVLLCPPREMDSEQMIRSVFGGYLVQNEDEGLADGWKVVTKQKIPEEKIELSKFGILACKHLRSNAIALVRQSKTKGYQLIGAGMGQPNRIDSLRVLAAPRAKDKCDLNDVVMVSDAFFPFPDVVEQASEEGIRVIIQPGGSIKDQVVIEAADKAKIAMAFTGTRHFRH